MQKKVKLWSRCSLDSVCVLVSVCVLLYLALLCLALLKEQCAESAKSQQEKKDETGDKHDIEKKSK